MSELETNRIITGDCLEVMADLPADSVHAVVTDPPYGLAFMGRSWDDFEPKEYQEFCENWAREAKRVLKPGGHLLAFSGNRTHHRLFSGVEDAGFEIRDTVTWHYGTGFPKALDVSKAIDKQAGVDDEREVVGVKPGHEDFADRDTTGHLDGDGGGSEGWRRPWQESDDADDYHKQTAPATDAAEKWDGFKTALKPATEFVVVARKPLGEDTVAENVLEHGTGALNIDGCRVDTGEIDTETATRNSEHNQTAYGDGDSEVGEEVVTSASEEGRYPANVVFGEQAAAALDAEVGELESGNIPEKRTPNEIYGNGEGAKQDPEYNKVDRNDSGGPSRYFYTSKATRAERTLDGKIENAHPTVKPPDLMEWLVKLVTAEGQIVLDPFAGTGTTCRAARDLAREFVGVEKQAKWADVARVRCGLSPEDPSHVRPDDAQTGIEQF